MYLVPFEPFTSYGSCPTNCNCVARPSVSASSELGVCANVREVMKKAITNTSASLVIRLVICFYLSEELELKKFYFRIDSVAFAVSVTEN